MAKYIFYPICLNLLMVIQSPIYLLAQDYSSPYNLINDSLSILFYNTENLFDDINNFDSEDDEYSSGGIRNWNTKRYNQKINRISRAVLSSNGWKVPDLIGLCEIENRNVVGCLINSSLLQKAKLKCVHKESPDRRGIDVCLLYNPLKVHLLDTAFLRVKLSEGYCSRDILYAKMKCYNDTLHVFVCHWPSRYGGHLASNPNRLRASQILNFKIDLLYKENRFSKIIIMGDLNDELKDESILNILSKSYSSNEQRIVNVLDNSKQDGTIKYKDQWFIFDHFLISTNLLNRNKKIFCETKGKICTPSFLLINDEKHLGKKPFRTYQGYKYNGGYSDHLPILLKLKNSQ
jgi:predicted extracellular nuclease